MAKIQLSLTEYGHKLLLQQGSFKTFKKFTVSDDGVRYDVTEEPNLTDRICGGIRTLVTSAPTCGYSSSKQINNGGEDESKFVNEKLEWSMSKESDNVNSENYTNIKVNVNLKTWFNYLMGNIGPKNYNYNNRLQVNLIESIGLILKNLDPSDFQLKQVKKYDNINMSYFFNNDKSKEDYESLNTYLMTTNRGKKMLKTSTDNKFWSPFLLVADTNENQLGSGDNWVMSLSTIEWGYVAIKKSSDNNVFMRSDFYTITQIESMSEDEINNTYKSIRPACLTSKKRSNDDLFVLEDVSGKYTEGLDMLPTYAQRFKNSNGMYLLESLVNKSVKYIKTNFKENKSLPGIYEKNINLTINNTMFDGNLIEKNKFIGGNIEFILTFDESETDNNYENIVTWN